MEQAVQILIVTLEHEAKSAASVALKALDNSTSPAAVEEQEVKGGEIDFVYNKNTDSEFIIISFLLQPAGPDNLFVNYLSRIHREEVLQDITSCLVLMRTTN